MSKLNLRLAEKRGLIIDLRLAEKRGLIGDQSNAY
jgi:hypothetical protein